jgi:hypothetical protein
MTCLEVLIVLCCDVCEGPEQLWSDFRGARIEDLTDEVQVERRRYSS